MTANKNAGVDCCPRCHRERSEEWSGRDSRIWAAHRGRDEEALLAYVLPAEVEVLVTDHLMLLRDLGGIFVLTSNPTEMGLRLYATGRIDAFVRAGIVTKHQVNTMSRVIVGEDLYHSSDDDCLGIDDLDFELQNVE